MATTTNFGWETPDDTDLVKDGAAAMRTLGNSIDTSFVDLKGGTTGQVLAKASATDLDYSWTTPQVGDITSITATSPLTGGGTTGDVTVGIQAGSTTQSGALQLTDSISSTSTTTAATPNSVKTSYDLANAAIAKSTVTTAGDIIFRNATVPTRLGIGTAGQVLQVNSGATAPEWATPAGGGGMTLLSTTALTGAAVTVSSISGSYKALKILVTGASNATADGKFSLKFNSLTADAYLSVGEAGTFTNQQNTFYQTVSNVDRTNAVTSWNFDVFNYANTTYPTKSVFASVEYFATGAVMKCGTVAGVQYLSATAISSVTVANSGGNFSSGTILIYGVN